MSTKFKITKTEVTDDHKVRIEYECSATGVTSFTRSVVVENTASTDEIEKMINDDVYNAMEPAIAAKAKAVAIDAENAIKLQACNAIKAKMDKDIGKEKPVKKPKKVE